VNTTVVAGQTQVRQNDDEKMMEQRTGVEVLEDHHKMIEDNLGQK